MDYKLEKEVIRKDLVEKNESKFVMAGAGAGKTFSLVRRIFNQIKDGVQPENIVAISFTNKSAEDLREKIIEALDLEKMEKKHPKDFVKLTDDNKDNIKKALETIDLMHISTIHKFCGDILRENSIYSSASPDFQIMEDTDDYGRKEAFINMYIRNLDADTLNMGKNLVRDNYSISENVKTVFNVLSKYIDTLPKDKVFNCDKFVIDNNTNAVIAELVKEAKGNFEKIIKSANDYARKLYLVAKDECDDITGVFAKKYVDYYLDKVTKRNIEYAFSKILYKSSGEKSPFNGRLYVKTKLEDMKKALKNDPSHSPEDEERVKKYEKELSQYCSLISEYKDKNKESVIKFSSSATKIITIYKNYILDIAYKAYLTYLKALGTDHESVSNDQLLVLANKLLDNKDVCERLSKKYKHIYIDEYQDTDHVQRDIALKIRDIDKLDDDSSIFLVGDPKQSIYRFRGAEPNVYFDTKKLFDKPKTKTYDLNINFRSNEKILDYVNETFKTMKLTPEAYTPMLVRKANEIEDEDYADEKKLIGFYRFMKADPESVANLIKYIKAKYLIRKEVGKDEDDEPIFEYQNIEYRDIMVQMPGHKKMSSYIKTFSDNKIPSRVAGESNFRTVYQIRAFINLYEAINTRGISSRQMAYDVFRTLYSKKYKGKTVKECNKLSENIYNMLISETKEMNSYAKAIYLVENIKYIMKEEEKLEAFEINSIVSKLYQIIETVFSTNYENGSKMANLIREYVDANVEYESLIDSDADAVQVINVHKAKGLEAPIVIFACVGGKPPTTATYFDDQLFIKSGILDYFSSNEVYQKQIEAEDKMEIKRLEYVAATRPREAFIYATEGSSYLFELDIEKNKDPFDILKLREIPYERMDGDKDEEYDDYEKNNHIYNVSNPSLSITSPSSKESSSSKTRTDARIDAVKKGISVKSNRPTGNILGTILHRVFELKVKYPKDSYESIIEFALLENKDFIKSNVDDYVKFITICLRKLDEYFIENDFYGTTLKPEFKFSSEIDDKEVSNGSIDLLQIKGDTITIYDYKSDEAEYIEDDSTFEDTLREKYQSQLDDYEKIVRNIYPEVKTINKKIIYFRRYNPKGNDIDVMVCDL